MGATTMAMRLGGGNLRFEPVEHWEKLPAGWSCIDVAGVAVDARGNVYVFVMALWELKEATR